MQIKWGPKGHREDFGFYWNKVGKHLSDGNDLIQLSLKRKKSLWLKCEDSRGPQGKAGRLAARQVQ